MTEFIDSLLSEIAMLYEALDEQRAQYAHTLSLGDFDLCRCSECLLDNPLPEIRDVIFNDPATIVLWEDDTKTIVKCQKDKGDIYNKEMGLAMCIVKKIFNNNSRFNEIFDRWCRDE